MFDSFLKRPFWQSLFTGTAGSGRTKYTFEELRALSDVLNKNQVVTEANKAVVVETIRSIAEFIIWGDQNEPRIFEYFMENNVMHYLHRVLQQPANRSGDVAKQVLQTLSIIIQNVRSENGTYFLFSNNHINNIVEIRFDFDDEEVLGYYISFLKTISLKLNAGTVQFFFDRRESVYTFPLYMEAVKFAHHKEGMVRAGVRTLTLNVYSVQDSHIQEYVCHPPATSYIADMVAYIADQVKILDKRMASAEGFSAQVLSSLDSQLAEVEDMVSYVADILTTAHPRFAHLVAEQLWVSLVGPYLLRPLVEVGTGKAAVQGHRRSSAGGGPPSSPGRATPLIRAVCSLYALERLFVLITYPPLLNNLALALLDPRTGHPSCRAALVALLRTEDHRAVPAALRCLVAAVHNRHLAPEVLALLGLVPRQRAGELHTACGAGDCAACRLRDALPPLPEDCPAAGTPPDALAEEAQPVATAAAGTSGLGLAGSAVGAPVFGYHVLWTRLEGPSQASPDRQDYDGRYQSDNDNGVDASLSSLSEAAGAPRQLPVGNGADAEEDEEEAQLQVQARLRSQAASQAAGGSEADLLGLALDASNGDATRAPKEMAGEQPSPAQDDSLPVVFEVSLDTPLEVHYSRQDVTQGTGPASGITAGTPSGQLEAGDALPTPAATSAPPQPTPAAHGPQPAQVQEPARQEVDLLGVPTLAAPAAAVAGDSRQAAAVGGQDLLSTLPAASSTPAAPDAVGLAVASLAAVASGDLMDALTGPGPAAAPAAQQLAASPLDALVPPPAAASVSSLPAVGAPAGAAAASVLAASIDDLMDALTSAGPAPEAGDAATAQQPADGPLDALAPPAPAESAPSLAAAASGSLLDSLLEPAASGSPAASGAVGLPPAHQQPATPQSHAQPGDPPSLADLLPSQAAPAAPVQAPVGELEGGGAAGVPGLLNPEGGSEAGALLPSAGPSGESGAAGAAPLLDLLDAPLHPAGPSGGGAPAEAAEAASPAVRGDPLEDLLGPSTAVAAAADAVISAPAASAAGGPEVVLEDLLGPSVAASGGPEAPPAEVAGQGASGGGGGGTSMSSTATAEQQGSAAVAETAIHEAGPAAAGLLEAAEVDTPNPHPPPPPPPPPAAPLPPPAAPPPAETLAPCPAHARPAAVASSADILDSLFALLSMQLLPIAGLWNVVLLLGQLYPRGEEQRELRRLLEQQPQQQLLPLSTVPSVADQLADLLGVGDEVVGSGGQDPAASASGSATPRAVVAPGEAASSAGPSSQQQQQQEQPHPLDPASTVGWACELSGSQREALRVAAVSAASAVLDEVGGMWCDALLAMLVLEWPAAHDAVTRPSLRTGAERLMAGPHLYPRQHARALSGASRNDQGLSGSAVAALHSYHAVSRLVALLLLHDLLRSGAVTRQPPATCPLPPSSADVEGREMDVLEGQEVELQAGSAIPCIVSFSPGQERRVYFAAAGPALRRLADYLHNPQSLVADPASQAVVMHSSPAVVLADPAPTRLNAGIVLSVSPLLGAEPSVDKNVAKWLHVHVRPSVRGLLRLLRSAAAGRKGGLLGALRHLVDGHWVLAFPDAERSSNARQLVEQSAHRLRALYCELLSPLLSTVME